MSLSDFFKSMFGFKDYDRSKPNEKFPEVYDEGDDYEEPHNDTFDDVFRHFHGSMFRQMEELSRQMEDMFRHSGNMEFPSGFEGPEQKPPGNPRDHMLKEPDSYAESPVQQPPRALPPNGGPEFFHPPSIFGRFSPPRWKKPAIEDQQDQDLDGKAKIDDIVDLFKNSGSSETPDDRHNPSSVSPFRSFSRSSSWSSQTIRGTDGKIEQKKTVRDSDGNEETTITRSIGGQTHSVTVKKDKTGATEKIENFQNMDQEDLQKFDDKWRNKQCAIDDNPRDKMLIQPPKKMNPEDESIFKKFFG